MGGKFTMLHPFLRQQRANQWTHYSTVFLVASTIAFLCVASASMNSGNHLSRNIRSRRNVIKGVPLAWAISSSALNLMKEDNAVAAGLAVTKYDTVSLFGRIATSSCYGKIANRATCQIDGDNLMGRLLRGSSSISKEQFKENIRDLQFEWPLKPYGQEMENKVVSSSIMEIFLIYFSSLGKNGNFKQASRTK